MVCNNRTVFIVCLYGLFDEQRRTAREMAGYRAYLQSCAETIVRRSGDVHVVLAGGYTTELELSEAASVYPFFCQLLEDGGHPSCPVYLEATSINHPQNIAHSVELIERMGLQPDKLVIYCDSYRVVKAKVLARRLVPRRYQCEIRGFDRPDTHPNSCYWRQWLAAVKYFLRPSTVQADLDARRSR